MTKLTGHRSISWVIASILIGFTTVSLNACNGRIELRALNKHITEVTHRSAQPIPPVPHFKPYQRFTYSAANLRDPFIPLSQEVVRPLMKGQRTLEPLEMFSLDALRMVGSITIDNKIWALIAAPDGNVYKAGIGSYLGQNEGQVVAVAEQSVRLIEQQDSHARSITLRLNAGSPANSVTNQ